MIRLASLLREISFGASQPYATQFTWSTFYVMGQTYYESKFDADGQHVEMYMSPINTQNAEREYIFVFMTRDKWGTSSYSHNSSVAKGHIDYLRLIRTVGEAIMDFCVQYAPEAVDISGGDADSTMKQKKNRIYASFLQHNASRLAQSGYTSLQRGDSLWIVRKQDADSTGIQDKQ